MSKKNFHLESYEVLATSSTTAKSNVHPSCL